MTATATRRDHRNTDRSNAYCHCPATGDHGNLPQTDRVTVLHALLRRFEVELVSDDRGTLVVPVQVRDTQPVRRALQTYGIEPRHHSVCIEGERGLYVVAEAFNR